jgi:hypothetical protein
MVAVGTVPNQTKIRGLKMALILRIDTVAQELAYHYSAPLVKDVIVC